MLARTTVEASKAKHHRWITVRELLVITGTISATGGNQTRFDRRNDGTRIFDQRVTQDRRRANVIATSYLRKLRALEIVHTDFGRIVDPSKREEVDELIFAATRDAAEFNKASKTCRIVNSLICEKLRGNRKAAVEGWLARKRDDREQEILDLLPLLQESV